MDTNNITHRYCNICKVRLKGRTTVSCCHCCRGDFSTCIYCKTIIRRKKQLICKSCTNNYTSLNISTNIELDISNPLETSTVIFSLEGLKSK